MKCVLCRHGETGLGTTIVTLTRNALTLVEKDVPAIIADHCGEEYVEDDCDSVLPSDSGAGAESGRAG